MEYPSGLATKPTSIYSPLSDSNEIRLLDLQPRRPGEGIKCITRHVKLSEKPQYEALSYMWGPKEHRQIEIDGAIVEVRHNLWDALLELRPQKDTRTLWIDAICINQDDISERNHQVTQMGTMYKNALVETQDIETVSMVYNSLFYDASPSEWDIRLLRALASLCVRPYWERLWIIQEILLAPNFFLQCGPYLFNKTYLRILFQELHPRPETIGSGHLEPFYDQQSWQLVHERMGLLQTMRESMAFSLIMGRRFAGEDLELPGSMHRSSRSVFQLCSIYGTAKCEDQRDKIFGLLGIASPCCSDAIQVDYSAPLSQIAEAVLRHHIYEHQDGDQRGAPMALESSISFHRHLGITPMDYKPPLIYPSPTPLASWWWSLQEQEADEHIFTTAELLDYGSLGYISPPLDGSVRLERCRILALPPRLGTWLQIMGTTLMAKKILRSMITIHLDLVLPLDHSTYSYFLFALANLNPPPRTQPTSNLNSGAILFRKSMLGYQAALAQMPQLNDRRLAFTQSGLSFLVPKNVRKGDVVCNIRGTNDLIIGRPTERDRLVFHLVARSVFNL